MKPGEQLDVSENAVQSPLYPFDNFLGMSPWDRVLENVIGSGYEYSYERIPERHIVRFKRLDKPLTNGRRTYVSPDRRHLYRQLPFTGIWEPIR